MTKIGCVVLAVLVSLATDGQSRFEKFKNRYNEKESRLFYGLTLSAIRSNISGLYPMIMSESYFINFSMEERKLTGWGAGAFLNYRCFEGVSIQGDLFFGQQGGALRFNNEEKDFNYDLSFKHEYVNIGTKLKVYPLCLQNSEDQGFGKGINLFAGAQWGLNAAPSNIIYKSGGSGKLTEFGSDLEQQQQIRNVLKGRRNIGVSAGIGWDLKKFPIVVDLRWFWGIPDVVETMANSHKFIENDNKNKYMQLTLGWDLSFFAVE